MEEAGKPRKKVPFPYSCTHRKTQLQVLVSKFTRDQYNNTVDSALQKDPGTHSYEDNCRIIREILESEEISLQDREMAAQKDILNSIQTQKYG